MNFFVRPLARALGRDDSFGISCRRAIIAACQTVLIVSTYYFSYFLRFDGKVGAPARAEFIHTVGVLIAIKLIVFYAFGLLRGWWRYAGFTDLVSILKAAVVSSLAFALMVRIASPVWFPRSVIAIDFLLTIVTIGGARFAVRAYRESVHRRTANPSAPVRKRMLIAGAGQAGTNITRELLNNPDLGYQPIGFVDDDRSKWGIRIHGIKVVGPISSLATYLDKWGAVCVLIAMPSVHGRLTEQIFEICHERQVEVKILPAARHRIHGSAVSHVRTASVEDLLGRQPVNLETARIRSSLENKTVLITGAAGSIGSEISRQVARFRPAQLVLVERAESPLFEICTELAASAPEVKCTPVIADILDVGLLRDVFAHFKPQQVFHAAAYKHVPIMERHCFQAVTNNVFGTYNVALLAAQYAAERFVFISTDKAVNPTNVMGVTKRIGELIVLAMQNGTRFLAVRFGNVLGSNGSVVPIFAQQIARGGPVTVTHPEATRFLMTIPEAAQLVLQAATMQAKSGEIFMLKMGQPVRIVELAENMIRLSGLKPRRDIDIVFTGLRPGEKLNEQLSSDGEGTMPTAHDRICTILGRAVSQAEVRSWMNDLAFLVESKNVARLIDKLQQIVPEYSPSPELLAMCEVDRHDIGWQQRRASASFSALESAA